MRHNKKFNHLGRTASHRSAMLANMAVSLIMHKRITTTLAKAKALKMYVEPLITRCKDDSTNSRRVDFDENMAKTAKAGKKTRRSRKSTAAETEAPAAEVAATEEPKAE